MSDELDCDVIGDQLCDACPQRAVARLDLDSGGRLYWCRHHLHVLFPETHVYEGMTFTYSAVTL